MGLMERRKIKEMQESTFPEREKELLEITGSPIRYEVDWDSLANDAEGLNFVDNLSCHRLNMALRVICSDALGKEAVADGLKIVKLTNVASRDERQMTFGSGVLEMRVPYALRTDGYFSDGEIRETLLRGL